MYGGTSAAFPVPGLLTGNGVQESSSRGMTIEQYAMIHIAAAMAGNQWYQGYSAESLADRAREITTAVINKAPG